MPVKAAENFAVSAHRRRSQASARDIPAPAQVPLIAATTGLGAAVSAVTSGL